MSLISSSHWVQFSSVQSLSRVWLFATPWTAPCQASLSITNSGIYSNSYPFSQWCHPTILSSVTPFSFSPQCFPASESFSNELALRIRWPEFWSFSFSISPSKEYSGLISFRMIGWNSLLSKGLSTVFSSTTVQNHQFFSARPLWSNSHTCMWLLEMIYSS